MRERERERERITRKPQISLSYRPTFLYSSSSLMSKEKIEMDSITGQLSTQRVQLVILRPVWPSLLLSISSSATSKSTYLASFTISEERQVTQHGQLLNTCNVLHFMSCNCWTVTLYCIYKQCDMPVIRVTIKKR
jgi:hypothetical protein